MLNFSLAQFGMFGWASSPLRFAVAAAVTIGFAFLARILHAVTFGGAVAGGVACFLLFAGGGPAAFATLAALFLMTWASTRFGYRRKLALGLAEPKEGRNAWQVFANLMVAAVGAAFFSATGNRSWMVATVAALSEAATDTVASEIGQHVAAQARLITTWERVPGGTDGGITTAGSVAGLAAGVAIVSVASAGGILPRDYVWIPVIAGFAGMLIDSFLGAKLQRRGRISNQTVNFLGTLAAAIIAYATWVAMIEIDVTQG
jgi:uncharacterized protein (TIGR00297 family)